jgi:hypothetical protein
LVYYFYCFTIFTYLLFLLIFTFLLIYLFLFYFLLLFFLIHLYFYYILPIFNFIDLSEWRSPKVSFCFYVTISLASPSSKSGIASSPPFFAPRLEGLHISRVSVLERHPRKLVTFSSSTWMFLILRLRYYWAFAGFFLTLTDITSPNIMSCPSPLYPFRETLRS